MEPFLFGADPFTKWIKKQNKLIEKTHDEDLEICIKPPILRKPK